MVNERNQLKNPDLNSEIVFTTSPSSGPGGQHVNKTETRVELRFNINDSMLLDEDEKKLIYERIAHRINNKGDIIITCQKHRSQIKNKQEVLQKFY